MAYCKLKWKLQICLGIMMFKWTNGVKGLFLLKLVRTHISVTNHVLKDQILYFPFLFLSSFLSKLSIIYIITNRTIKYIYIYNIYIHIYIHTHMYMYICIYIHTHTFTHIEIRLDDTKTAYYCFFINSKAKKLTQIH